MATVVHEHIETSPLEGFRVSWGGIWGGVLVVMGTLLLLTTLGLAIGVSAVDPRNTQAGTVGTAAAIWSSLSLLIALFLGGMAATRLGVILDKTTGILEGALVWVLSVLITLYLASSGVSVIASGVSGIFGGVSQAVGSAVTGMDNLTAGEVDQIISRLRDPQTARTIATATGTSEQEVGSTLEQVAQRAEAARNDPAQVAREVREGTADLVARARERLPAVAAQVQQDVSKTAWITFAALAISLLAAVIGSMLGRRRIEMRLATLAETERATTRPDEVPPVRNRW